VNDYLNSLGPLGMLQAYRAQPFSLYTDMSRPAQFLPQGLPAFDYSTQYRALQQQLANANTPPSGRGVSEWSSAGPGSGDAAAGGVGDGGAAAAAGDGGGGGGGGGK
jgi:hypothetical protein